jgi:hypothetical protein
VTLNLPPPRLSSSSALKRRRPLPTDMPSSSGGGSKGSPSSSQTLNTSPSLALKIKESSPSSQRDAQHVINSGSKKVPLRSNGTIKPLFEGLKFLLSGYAEGDKKYLASEITKAGGKIIDVYPWKKKIDDEIELKEKSALNPGSKVLLSSLSSSSSLSLISSSSSSSSLSLSSSSSYTPLISGADSLVGSTGGEAFYRFQNHLIIYILFLLSL